VEAVEQDIKKELKELAEVISFQHNKVYFIGIDKSFSITIPRITNLDINFIKEFCAKNNLEWQIQQATGKNEIGVSVVFNLRK
jgi:hypothetical protein